MHIQSPASSVGSWGLLRYILLASSQTTAGVKGFGEKFSLVCRDLNLSNDPTGSLTLTSLSLEVHKLPSLRFSITAYTNGLGQLALGLLIVLFFKLYVGFTAM